METCIEKLKKTSAEIDKLFEVIKDKMNETEVVKDGIIDIPKYCSSKYKILWVLKETNDPDGGWDMKNGLLNSLLTVDGITKAARPTFLPIIYTSYGILNDKNWDFIPDLDRNDQSVANIIENIGFVNVKKLPGGAQNNPDELKKAYDQYGYIVRRQIIDYNPDIVIFGGTDYLLTKDLGLSVDDMTELLGVRYWVKNNKLYIRAYHPGQHGNIEEYCDEIINTVRSWEQMKK